MEFLPQDSDGPNADGRPKTAAGETFTYDAFGERTVLAVTGGGTHDIFGLNHELLAENNTAGQAQRSYIYLNGAPLAVVDALNSAQINQRKNGQTRCDREAGHQSRSKNAIQNGQSFDAPNNINPQNGATRYVSPQTGQSVVVDNATGEVIHIGRPGFAYCRLYTFDGIEGVHGAEDPSGI